MGDAAMAGSVLYVHVADDGGILAIDAGSGRSAWVVLSELSRRLQTLRSDRGSVLLSREAGSPMARPVLELVRSAEVPVIESPEIHPDAVRAGGATALMAAAYVGADELARDLVARGAQLETRDQEGFTALMYAANGGQEAAVRLLVDAGAAVDATDREGSTPLMFAAQHGHLRIVKKLLSAGASVAARRADGLAAHDFAARNGHPRVAAILQSAAGQES
jgi:hypothetical protein